MRKWHVWDWSADPEAPLSWPDPERRIVLCEPGIIDPASEPALRDHASNIICKAMRIGLAAVVPGKADGLRRIEYQPPSFVPALLVRRQADLLDIGALLAVSATHRALYCEPEEALDLHVALIPFQEHDAMLRPNPPPVDLVIVRGRDKPSRPDWVRGIRDQCKATGVAFCFLGWGTHITASYSGSSSLFTLGNGTSSYCLGKRWFNVDEYFLAKEVGPERSGRMLDGREWLEVPEGI